MIRFINKLVSRRSVSRVLSACAVRPFLWGRFCNLPLATNPGGGTGMFLLNHGFRMVSHDVTMQAGRPYSVLLPVGFTLPILSPELRCALTAPFHPYPMPRGRSGGLFSVALSLGSPPPAVSRHRIPVEPGLSSTWLLNQAAAVQPSGWGPVALSFSSGQPPRAWLLYINHALGFFSDQFHRFISNRAIRYKPILI